MKYIFLIITISFFTIKLSAQSDILNNYIDYGIENNLSLKQKQFDYEKSQYALKEAKGLFYPRLSLNARISVADGGRVISFPVGDMLNPVYSTLNQLTDSENFPQIGNEETQFMRPFEHETKLSLIQPVFNPAIYFNSKIQNEIVNSKAINRDIYKRNLIAEIKIAYLNHLKANKAVELTNETRKLILENIRVNKSLFENDKVTIDNIYRSQEELSKMDQQMAEAEKSLQITRKYFNFLLNKPLNEEVLIDENLGKNLPALPVTANSYQMASQRSELKLMNTYASANSLNQSLNQSGFLPTVSLAADYGFQGSEYQFNSENYYTMLSVVLKWDLFTGFRRKAKVQQTSLEGQAISTRYKEMQNQLELQIDAAYLDLLTSKKAIDAAQKQQTSAEKTFYLINKKYKEGQANLLQYLDAQTTLTNARENYWIVVYDYYMKLAEYEKQVERNIN